MQRDERLLRGAGIAQVVTAPGWRPYRRFGEDWDPAALGPIKADEDERDAQKRRYAAAREQRLTIEAAAGRAGVGYEKGRVFERELRQAGEDGWAAGRMTAESGEEPWT